MTIDIHKPLIYSWLYTHYIPMALGNQSWQVKILHLLMFFFPCTYICRERDIVYRQHIPGQKPMILQSIFPSIDIPSLLVTDSSIRRFSPNSWGGASGHPGGPSQPSSLAGGAVTELLQQVWICLAENCLKWFFLNLWGIWFSDFIFPIFSYGGYRLVRKKNLLK